jgi:protein-disulfide isomerase
VGGAERNERKRKQNAARAVAAARRSSTDRTKIIIGVAVVAVLAIAVIGGILYQRAQTSQQTQAVIPPVTVSTNSPVQVQDPGVVVVGKDTAKVTLDAYEDFLCPACGVFEAKYGKQVENALSDGSLRVRYHMLNLLDERSSPPGYSLRAANAALCSVSSGKFVSYHDSLYGKQPKEGSAGYTDDQLIRLGNALGVPTTTFDNCVRSGQYQAQVRSDYTKATTDPTLQRDVGGGQKSFVTPTIVAGGTIVNVSDPNWLTQLLQQPSGQTS